MEPGVARPMHHMALVALAIMAVFANQTAVRRLRYIHRTLKARDREKREALAAWDDHVAALVDHADSGKVGNRLRVIK